MSIKRQFCENYVNCENCAHCRIEDKSRVLVERHELPRSENVAAGSIGALHRVPLEHRSKLVLRVVHEIRAAEEHSFALWAHCFFFLLIRTYSVQNH